MRTTAGGQGRAWAMMAKHNILIVDDHRISQAGVRFLFASADRYAVVGALDRGATVNAYIQSQPVDLVILDLNLPDVRGVNVLAEIVGSRDMTVIVLTGETNIAEIHSALKLGARAIVSKADPLDHIVAACDAALAGEIYISPHISEALGKFDEPAVALSSRQMAILHYLAQGETNKEIAYRLAIAPPTVSFHIAELRRKLGVSHNRKIVERANELKLL
ncbi:MAG: response regulator transcription factor [Sphingopyxis sp.]|uniref:response regulator transcription factor n=1 Tax=Sphingopyxis sp. TaxID=1908224 RepID=UPI001A5FBC5F|nr:response regulator transcription factor [Sphingopyxis sp.]MBL9067173.1 response regulator transcription factor [Sphingopyxis sp.]